MLKYELFYRKIGVRKLFNFLDPIVLKKEEFIFPVNTAMHYNKITDLAIGPNRDEGYFKFLKKPTVVTIKEYISPVGGHTYNLAKIKAGLLKNKKDSSDFLFIPLTSKRIKVTKGHLLIYNYGLLNTGYKYKLNPLNRYYKWYNNLSTVVGTINNDSSGFRHFINIELPHILPTRVSLDKYSNMDMNRTVLNKLLDSKSFNVLELWRLLTPELFGKSILGKIDKKKISDVDLVFTLDNKVSVISLETLLAMVEGYSITTKIKKQPSNRAKKIFYLFLLKLIEKSAINYTEIEEENNKIQDKYLNKSKKGLADRINSAVDIMDIEIGTKSENNVNVDSILTDEYIEQDEPTDDIGDELVSEVDELALVNEVQDSTIDIPYDNLEDLLKEEVNVTEKLFNNIIEYSNTEQLTPKESKRLLEILEKQNGNPNPYGEKGTIKDMTTISQEELVIDNTELPDNDLVLDKTMLHNTGDILEKEYIKNIYKKDIISTIYSLQSSDIVIEDYTIEKEESILGKSENHIIKIKPIDGRPSTIRIKLPTIEEDGTFKMSGNSYSMRKQRSSVVIKKLDFNKVALTTYYGKLFITKSKYKKDDLSFWLYKQLIKMSIINKDLKNITASVNIIPDVKLPRLYTLFSRNIKNFTFKDSYFYFGYEDRKKIIKKEYIDTDIEKKKYVIAGEYKGKFPILIDNDGYFFIYKDGKYIPHIDVLEELGINLDSGPIEFSNIRIFKKEIPTALLLVYYLGFDNLVKLLKCKYTTMESNKRYLRDNNEYIIKFLDIKYIFNREDKLATMILGGIHSISKHIKTMNKDVLNNRESLLYLFNLLDYPLLYINEIKLLENSYIDPMSKTVLEEMKEPTTFKGLLIRSNELLLSDYYTHPNNIEVSTIKGYERIPGMVYNQMIGNIRDYKNRSAYGKSKIDNDVFAVWKNINGDSTTVPVDDLNPIAMLKQSEDVTYAGMGGLTSQSLSKSTREYHTSEIGVISEATKDNGDVGLTAYLSANPKIKSLRGTSDTFEFKKDGFTSVLSTVAMISPGVTHDVGKRSNFANIQHSHIAPTINNRAPQVRTGYESVLSHRAGDKFVAAALEEGKVLSKSKSKIVVEYKTAGKKSYKLGQWSGKDESGSAYIHEVVSLLSKGSKVKANDVITYDKMFFELDMFDSTQVVYKTSSTIYTALIEDANTDEDASMMSKKMSKKLISKLHKIKSYKLTSNDNIVDIVKVGDKVEPKTVIYTSIDEVINNDATFDKEALATLQKIKRNNPTAKIRGKVDKIVFYYNEEEEELSKTLKKLIAESNENLTKEHGKPITGKVTSEYSIKGVPLLPGEIELKVYISYEDDMGIGDKGIFGNQLKTTISSVYDYTVETEDGKDVDAIFSWKALQARTVLSPLIIGTTTLLLDKIADDVVSTYFK